MDHLNRSLAEWPPYIWKRIDSVAAEAAKRILTTRRYLDVKGPFGVGLTAVELGNDTMCCDEDESDQAATAAVSRAIAVPTLRKTCRLSVRRLVAHLDMGGPLNLADIESAAEAVARREEALAYYGQPEFGLEGLLTAQGSHHARWGDWTQLDTVLADVLTGISKLDASGFSGPYALAVPAEQYNNLFRRYENTDLLQIEHLKSLCTQGVYKASIDQPVIVEERAAVLILGEDMRVGYVGTDGIDYRLFVGESLVLRVDEPEAICVLKRDA